MTSSVRNARVGALAAAVVVAVAVVVPPARELAEASVTAHMAQHLVLILVVAPLIAAGPSAVACLTLLAPSSRRRVAALARLAPHALRHCHVLAVAAWLAQVGVLWLWHTPRLYDMAVANPAAHVIEHASLVATAWLFWLPVVDARVRRRVGPGAIVIYLFAAAGQSTGLGALLALADRRWYSTPPGGAVFGLTALDDQRLAGLLMWIPCGAVYAAAALIVLGRLLAPTPPDGRNRQDPHAVASR